MPFIRDFSTDILIIGCGAAGMVSSSDGLKSIRFRECILAANIQALFAILTA